MSKAQNIICDDDISFTQVNAFRDIPKAQFDETILAEALAENPLKYDLAVKFQVIKRIAKEISLYMEADDVYVSEMQIIGKRDMIGYIEELIEEQIRYMMECAFEEVEYDLDHKRIEKSFAAEYQAAEELQKKKELEEEEARKQAELARSIKTEQQERKLLADLIKKYKVATIPTTGVNINIPKRSFGKAKKQLDEAGIKYSSK